MEERHQNATNTMHYQVITCNISCGFEPPVVQKVDNAINRTIVFFNTYGSLHVSGKLPTYPSSKLTLTLTSHLGQNVSLGEGRWVVSQKRKMIRFVNVN